MQYKSLTHYHRDLQELVDEGQLLGAISHLSKPNQRIVERVLREENGRVRRLIRKVLTTAWESFEKDRGHLSYDLMSIALQFRQVQQLLQMTDYQFDLGQYSQVANTLRTAKNTFEEESRRSIEQRAEQYGRSLIPQHAWLPAFDFLQISSPDLLSHDAELRNAFAAMVQEEWPKHLQDCADGEQFNSKRMYRYFDVLQSVQRPDILYTCGETLQMRELQQFKALPLLAGKGWSHHIRDAFGRANSRSMPLMGEPYALTTEQITHIGLTYERYQDWELAHDAYFRAGAWQQLERLAAQLLRMNAGQLSQSLSLLKSRMQICKDPLQPETQQAIILMLSSLNGASVQDGTDRRRSKKGQLTSSNREQIEALQTFLY